MSQTNLLGPVYAEQLNSIFRYVTDDSQTLDLELVNVDVTDTPPDQEQFSLMFRAPPNMPPMQKTYRLEHDRLGTTDIFLVPVSKDQNGLYFEAVFNRFLQ
jgi:hypothetical protein